MQPQKEKICNQESDINNTQGGKCADNHLIEFSDESLDLVKSQLAH